MPNKTKTDVQINTSHWILIFRTNNKKQKTALMLKIYYSIFLASMLYIFYSKY